MKNIKLRSHVGADGVLHLNVPVSIREQELEVIVSYQPVKADLQTDSPEALGYSPSFFEETAGAWQGEPLVRGEQGSGHR